MMISNEIPANNRAEQILLGSIIINNLMIDKVSEFLLPEHFYETLHNKIYTTLIKLLNKNISPTIEILATSLKDDVQFKVLGGSDYLVSLTKLALIEINPHSYAHLIYELFLRRNLISIAQDISGKAYNTDVLNTSAEGQIQEAETALFRLSSSNISGRSFTDIASVLKESIHTINLASKNPSHINGVTSGFFAIDKMFAGFQNSDLIILAARPSMGKTALAIKMALKAAKSIHLQDKNRQYSVGFFSLEMSAEQLSTRILSMETEINSNNLRAGFIDELNYNKIIDKSKDISQLNLYIDDTPALSIANIRTRARRLKRQNNLDILFIDYLQLIRTATNKESRVLEISEITQGLKALAKELNIPIIALSQLSRAVEQRVDKRPLLSDLRESGSIEQDADIVMFIYREEYYLRRSQPANPKEVLVEQEKLARVKDKAEIIVAKHRNGAVGSVTLKYNDSVGEFQENI